jgi:Zn-finger nucleic acid-binding protein
MCPECREPMVVVELEGIELDRCTTCRGTWLDAGELEHIVERAGAQREALSAALRAAGTGLRGQRRCPRCRRRLRVISIGHTPPVVVDRCPAGHGLWLDAGELRATVQAFAAGQAGPVARFLADALAYEIEQDSKGD